MIGVLYKEIPRNMKNKTLFTGRDTCTQTTNNVSMFCTLSYKTVDTSCFRFFVLQTTYVCVKDNKVNLLFNRENNKFYQRCTQYIRGEEVYSIYQR